MPVTSDDVRIMAQLARLHVDAETTKRFTRQFGDILSYMDILNQIDTTDVAPLYSPSLHGAAVREDVPVAQYTQEQVLQNAPEQDGQYFIVPRIV